MVAAIGIRREGDSETVGFSCSTSVNTYALPTNAATSELLSIRRYRMVRGSAFQVQGASQVRGSGFSVQGSGSTLNPAPCTLIPSDICQYTDANADLCGRGSHRQSRA